MPEPVCSQETAEHIVRQSQALTAYSEKYVPARQRFTAHRRTSVACSVGRLHLLTLAPFELRLVAQIVASDNTASGTRSQHLSFVERQTGRRTGSRHRLNAHHAEGHDGPRKTGRYSRKAISRDVIRHCTIPGYIATRTYTGRLIVWIWTS